MANRCYCSVDLPAAPRPPAVHLRSAIGDRVVWQGGRAGAREALERRLKGFLEASWKDLGRLPEGLGKTLRKAPRGALGGSWQIIKRGDQEMQN